MTPSPAPGDSQDPTIVDSATGSQPSQSPRLLIDEGTIDSLEDGEGSLRELAVRAAAPSPERRAAAVAALRRELTGVLDGCDVWCAVWGPGCPCWPGEDDWIPGMNQLVPQIPEVSADMILDVVRCGATLQAELAARRGGSAPDRAAARAQLAHCARPTSSDPPSAGASAAGSWTPWLDRDDPGGSGDYETLSDFTDDPQACALPVEVECRTKDGRDWREAGQRYTCSPETGGVCVNREQDEPCLDYEVRFRCSSGPQLALTCNEDQSKCRCDSPSSCAVLKLIGRDWTSRRNDRVLVGRDCRGTNETR